MSRRIQCVYSDRPKRENENTRTAHLFDEVHARLDRMETTMARIAAALEIKHEPAAPRRTLHDSEETPEPRKQHSYRESLEGSEAKSSPGDSQLHMGEVESGLPRDRSGMHQQTAMGRQFVSDVEGNAYYYGGASFLAISNEAAQSVQTAAKSPSPGRPSIQVSDVSEAQEKVGKLLDPDAYVTLVQPMDKGKGSKFWIPPKEPCMIFIEDYFNGPAWIFPLFDKERFVRQVEDMYANLDAAVDVGWLICYLQVIVFGIYGRLNDKDEVMREYLQQTERMKILQKASKVVWDCLEDTSVLLKPRLLNIQALMAMAAVANEISRPGLCWILVCYACSLAKAMGLHRNYTPNDLTAGEISERNYVFWTLYIMDKSLSLTFGRPSSFSDYDIDKVPPAYDAANPLWDLYISWIEAAQIQSEIHVRLYSAQAAKISREDRQKTVVDLDRRLGEWWTKYGVLLGRRYREEHFERSYIMTELVFCYHNTMIMIHRVNTGKPTEGGDGQRVPDGQGLSTDGGVIRGSVIESEMVCLEHARRGINLVRDTISKKTALAGSSLMMWYVCIRPYPALYSRQIYPLNYLNKRTPLTQFVRKRNNRLFSYYPFTAFFILFSNIIRYPHLATSKDDYKLLKFVVEFLESHKYVHAGAAKLFPVSQSFLQIAARFVDPASESVTQSTPCPMEPTLTAKHLGKRKLDETSHQPIDDELRVGMAPLPSETLLMQYPQQEHAQLDLTHASFITWPTTAGTHYQTQERFNNNDNNNIPQIITTQATPMTAAPYGAASSAAAGYDYMVSGAVIDDTSGWPQQSGNTAEFNCFTNTLGGAPPLGTYEAEFQDRVAMAAGEGPLGFDWFRWETWWEESGVDGGIGIQEDGEMWPGGEEE
ncbi:fungal-specific transcription factor domain-containing protein [Terfezia claveryi]|nr:fungal-specific transcription factor domain-containing protein [Terfezia claveryi]